MCKPATPSSGLPTSWVGKTRRIGDRVLLCTHATLAHTFKRLQKQGRLDRFKDLLLWIDEGHHIMNAQVDRRRHDQQFDRRTCETLPGETAATLA